VEKTAGVVARNYVVEVARMLVNGLLAYVRAVGAAFYTSSRVNNQGLKIKKIVTL
jgi:hypothetical protein